MNEKIVEFVKKLNTLWEQNDNSGYPQEMNEWNESKLVEIVVHICKTGFDLFPRFYDLIELIPSGQIEKHRHFVSRMNELFCEWCKCVAKKFQYKAHETTKTIWSKDLR